MKIVPFLGSVRALWGRFFSACPENRHEGLVAPAFFEAGGFSVNSNKSPRPAAAGETDIPATRPIPFIASTDFHVPGCALGA
jgi:hypothetical protein